MKNVHWVLYIEWRENGDGGCLIESVYHSKKEAVEGLKRRVEKHEKPSAIENGYKVYEDTDTCFDCGMDGFYNSNHVMAALQKVSE